MLKALHFIRFEDQKDYDDAGALRSSYGKEYFNYHCHDEDAQCQISPVVCRIVDRMHPENEPQWQSSANECERCFGANSRALEDLYERSVG